MASTAREMVEVDASENETVLDAAKKLSQLDVGSMPIWRR